MCGIVGVYNVERAAMVARTALDSLQHRGQESAGLVVFGDDGKALPPLLRMGLVKDALPKEIVQTMHGSSAVGHVRYSTSGTSTDDNIQPFKMYFVEFGTDLAVGHNGEIVNHHALQYLLGGFWRSSSDTETIPHLIYDTKKKSPDLSLDDTILNALPRAHGSYSLVMMTEQGMIAARDPRGYRPLSLAKKDEGFVVISEDYDLARIGARKIRDVEPGELLVFDKGGMRSLRIPQQVPRLEMCIFELIYFLRSGSVPDGVDAHDFRYRCGRELALEEMDSGLVPGVDIVVAVPDSGKYAAKGYAECRGIPLRDGLEKNPRAQRSFISPVQAKREEIVDEKFTVNEAIVRGKRLAVVDDSIVRGTTSAGLVKKFFAAGAKEVHLYSACPQVIDPCRYGIDHKSKESLIAFQKGGDIEAIRAEIQASSIRYLSMDGLLKATGRSDAANRYCTSCFTGIHPEFP